MTHYVAGFLFDATYTSVALVKKNRPEWQAGKLNAIGGKIEFPETPLQAMQREFQEETGVRIIAWDNFCILTGKDFTVFFFVSSVYQPVLSKCRTVTDEEIVLHDVNWCNVTKPDKFISNIRWLMPMAIAVHSGEEKAACLHVTEELADGET